MKAITSTIVDSNGKPIGTFTGEESTLALNIPAGGSSVPGEAQGAWWDGQMWQPMPPAPSSYHTFDWTKHAWVDERTDEQKAADAASELTAAKKAKIRELNAAMSAALESYKAAYPEEERETWNTQADECKAWFAASSPTEDLVPWCAACASSRGIELSEFMSKVKARVEAYSKASAEAVGKRRRLADEVDAAETIDAVNAISWS